MDINPITLKKSILVINLKKFISNLFPFVNYKTNRAVLFFSCIYLKNLIKLFWGFWRKIIQIMTKCWIIRRVLSSDSRVRGSKEHRKINAKRAFNIFGQTNKTGIYLLFKYINWF